ncbi:MAG: hypothetical protein KTR21_12325 [Rhodobacteraceae bacterium]|nr:hypothetical protein [Paracoccaceae bacterium]
MARPDSKEIRDLVTDLKALGFSDYESRIFIALKRKSPASAYEISNLSGVPRPNTYSVLKALEARGAVMPISENPVRYVPQQAERLFASIAQQTRDLCDTVTSRLGHLEVDSGAQYVWDLQGEDAVHGKLDEMIATAKTAIWIKSDSKVLHRHEMALREATSERDVRLVIILYGFDAGAFRFNDCCEVYPHEGTGFPMGFADNHFTITVDDREMLTANTDSSVIAAHTANRAIVKMAVSLLRHDFYMAEICSRFGREIRSEFGPQLEDLRKRCYSEEQFEMLERRRKELAELLPDEAQDAQVELMP